MSGIFTMEDLARTLRGGAAASVIPEGSGSPDAVHRPAHYTAHPSGVECIEIVKHMNFCLGNAVKYIWRAGLKADAVEDLQKAREYLDIEIARMTAGAGK